MVTKQFWIYGAVLITMNESRPSQGEGAVAELDVQIPTCEGCTVQKRHGAGALAPEEAEKLAKDQVLVSDFKQLKLEKEAQKNWDLFYKRNSTNFFKDRHWTTREFEELKACRQVSSICCTPKENWRARNIFHTRKTTFKNKRIFLHRTLHACSLLQAQRIDLRSFVALFPPFLL